MPSAASTPSDLLRHELRRDASRPLVTFYDDATGERVELSVATFDNWVAKTAGFLRDGLAVDADVRVALMLPPHWQSLVVAAACWTVGASALLDETTEVEVAVAGPDVVAEATDTGADEVVALALRPLGGRFTGSLPPGVLDYAVEVPGYPDHLAYLPPDPDGLALVHDGVAHTHAGLLAWARQRADDLGAEPGARLMVTTDRLAAALVDALLVPLTVGGSSVLVRHEDPSLRAARVSSERVSVLPRGEVPPGS